MSRTLDPRVVLVAPSPEPDQLGGLGREQLPAQLSGEPARGRPGPGGRAGRRPVGRRRRLQPRLGPADARVESRAPAGPPPPAAPPPRPAAPPRRARAATAPSARAAASSRTARAGSSRTPSRRAAAPASAPRQTRVGVVRLVASPSSRYRCGNTPPPEIVSGIDSAAASGTTPRAPAPDHRHPAPLPAGGRGRRHEQISGQQRPRHRERDRHQEEVRQLVDQPRELQPDAAKPRFSSTNPTTPYTVADLGGGAGPLDA